MFPVIGRVAIGFLIALLLTDQDKPENENKAAPADATPGGEKTIDVTQAGRALRMRRKQIRTRRTQRKKAVATVPPVTEAPPTPPDTGNNQQES